MSHATSTADKIVHVSSAYAKDRFILQQLVSKDFKLRYRRSVLGVVWSVLNPLLMMIVMSFVFSYFLRGSSVENYPLYLIVGNITFSLMNESTSAGLRSIIDAAPLLKKVRVDRWVFPVQKVFSAAFNFSFSLIAVAVVMLFFRVVPTWHIVWMIPALALLMVFCMGISLLIGSLAVFFRDICHLWSVVITAWTYATPLFYPASILPDWMMTVEQFNPMYHFVTYFREIVLWGQAPGLQENLLCLLFGIVTFAIGLAVFRKLQSRFILYV